MGRFYVYLFIKNLKSREGPENYLLGPAIKFETVRKYVAIKHNYGIKIISVVEQHVNRLVLATDACEKLIRSSP